MSRLEIVILSSLAMATLIVLAGAGLLLAESVNREPIPTLPMATVPPNPVLLTRVPHCQRTVGRTLSEHGWENSVVLDAQQGILTIQVASPITATRDLPADRIWGAFEAVLVGRTEGCTGYEAVVVQVGSFRAEVGVDDLSAWEAGALDDGAFGERVELSQ